MDTTHEEADIIIVQQMLMIANENCSGITDLSDDTDVFILLLYNYHKCGLHSRVTMESPIKQRVVLDIGSTVCSMKILFHKYCLHMPFLDVTQWHAVLVLAKELS